MQQFLKKLNSSKSLITGARLCYKEFHVLRDLLPVRGLHVFSFEICKFWLSWRWLTGRCTNVQQCAHANCVRRSRRLFPECLRSYGIKIGAFSSELWCIIWQSPSCKNECRKSLQVLQHAFSDRRD